MPTRNRRSNYDYYVGNIGHVASVFTSKSEVADKEFEAWRAQSQAPFGRASGEDVTVFKDGHLYREYQPNQGTQDDNTP